MKIYCCECESKIEARLTNGFEVYPHRKDLKDTPFWICDTCGNFVGCHYKQKSNPTQPLGCIASKEVKGARVGIHAILDPIWKAGKISRGQAYKLISNHIGRRYHTAQIRTIEDANKIKQFIKDELR